MPGSRGRTRLDAVDFIKTAAIVAVLTSHSGLFMFDPNLTTWDLVLTSTWNWYHVPAFLLVSGFLYFDEAPVRMLEITRRLLRVWIPYVLASLVMQLSGVANAKGPGQALYQIASASAIGAYYYIALASFCIAALWPLSRLGRGGAAVVLAALLAYAIALAVSPALHLPLSPLWQQRNPIESFWLGYFVLGWVAAQHRDGLTRQLERHRVLISCVAGAGALSWFAVVGRTTNIELVALSRVLYSVCVVVLIILLTRGHRAPRAVVFLSAATLTIYLYSPLPQLLLYARLGAWPPPLRIAFQFALGLAFGCALTYVGRRVLGPERAHRFLGA